jgi:diguanylate cyclase (GGDEF)-like protein
VSSSASASTSEKPAEARALVVEDCSALRRATCALLEDTGLFGEVLAAGDGFEALALLREHAVDLVLCDLYMPRCDGMELLRLRRDGAFSEDIPVVMLTGDGDIEQVVAALALGACDYVKKPAHSAEIRARVEVHLKLKLAADELRLKTDQLAQATRTDALTGVGNRALLDEALPREFVRARRYQRELAVVMIDLDHFKRINDRWGHPAGDHVLRHAARLFSEQLRQTDVLGRYGGEEFLLLLPETPLRGAVAAAERLRLALAASCATWDGQPLQVTASFGVAALPMPSVSEPMELVALADRALYRAKRQGRNRVGLPSPESGRIVCSGDPRVVSAEP